MSNVTHTHNTVLRRIFCCVTIANPLLHRCLRVVSAVLKGMGPVKIGKIFPSTGPRTRVVAYLVPSRHAKLRVVMVNMGSLQVS